jgi:hypothetical protein
MSNDINEEELTEDLIHAIREVSNPFRLASGNTEMVRRCYECGDSDNALHSHLYIELQPPYKFFCQRCNFAGVTTEEVLRNFKVNDESVISRIKTLNKNAKFSQKSTLASKNLAISRILFGKKLVIPRFIKSSNSIKKLEYFKKRSYLEDITSNTLKRFNVITDLDYFFEYNEVNDLPTSIRNERHYEQLCRDYIGYLHSDRILLRRMNDSKKKLPRFENINLSKDDSESFYVIHNDVSILASPLKLIMAEGVNSLIGASRHRGITTLEENDTIYVTASSKNFKGIIKHFLRLGFLDLEIEIYSDPEISRFFYDKILNNIPLLRLNPNMKFSVLWNDKNDFGEEEINISKIYKPLLQ